MRRAGAEIRLLGPVRVDRAAGPIDLGPRRRRLVLAVLALEVNRLVPVERLVDLAWPDGPPRTATHAIRVCVSGLRSALSADGGDELTIDTRGGGYVLRADPDRIDVGRFQVLLDRAADTDDDAAKVAVLDEALALWTGPALSGIAPEQTRLRLSLGLEEARLSAVEDRVDARLRLGCHAQVLVELTTAVRAHPDRERLVLQLMLALYRSGQAGAALQTYRDARQRLADEFGLDPGEALQRMEVAILRGDPGLLVPDRDVAPEPADATAQPGAHAVPAQLPATVGDFTGREHELAALDGLLPEHPGPSTMVVAGMAGVGKTTLAVRWAHRVRRQFPDGQLFADLAGFSTDPPAAPLRVLGEFLSALGVAGRQIPVGLTEASALYRSLLADRRVLVVLDNAADADQVRPLLPGGPGCRVVVTSRRGLGGLVARDGARRLALDVLTAGDAVDLLSRIVGAEEPDGYGDLARLCAYLPLAIRIAAANVSACAGHGVVDQIARLRDTDRLDSLTIDADDQAAVRAAFDLSYAALEPAGRRMFGLLGVAAGPHIGVPAAAALADVEPAEAARTLERLAGANLVERRSTGRYGMHDLLRLYAGERARAAGSAGTAAAVDRLDAFYLGAAGAAADVLYPSSPRLVTAPVETARAFDDDCAAGAWLDTERPTLVATVVEAAAAGRELAWLLADAMGGYLFLRRYGADWTMVAEAAFAAAERFGDTSARASAHRHLGGVHIASSRYREAVTYLRPALELARAAGWKAGEAAAHNNLGLAYDNLGQLDRAAAHFCAAQALYDGCGLVSGALAALSNLGAVHGRAGRLAEAAAAYRRSLADDRRRKSRSGAAADLSNLGGAVWRMGRLDEALEHLTAGLALHRAVGNRAGVANSLDYLARVHTDAGRLDLAAKCAEEALTVATEIGDRRIEVNVRNARAGIHGRSGRADVSSAGYGHARSLAVGAAFHHGQAEALIGLSRGSLARDRVRAAIDLAREALAVTVRHGFRLLECDARLALAEARLADDPAAAAEQVRSALAIQRDTGYRRDEATARRVLARAVGADEETVTRL
ncbi:AfsR/SARP family transcriptional regulator [Virgisporangium ochraceum]|uniref:SARP family transcriptional regulator n=1 Tax=Virgisporangium ochraceum TaxID=65505 RepID=A0A8J4A6D7_9ACTN|nr:BTAD domain-containing putative transcriptional regulator [Virgisporangium ochraceum]GIJ75367.1 SARP family transcriptional regulator [Virgisporangium ochraceum]